jgi:hypothetical protein
LTPVPDLLQWCPHKPSYPNWQRKRIQNPCSVSSSLTEGTQNTPWIPRGKSQHEVTAPFAAERGDEAGRSSTTTVDTVNRFHEAERGGDDPI